MFSWDRLLLNLIMSKECSGCRALAYKFSFHDLHFVFVFKIKVPHPNHPSTRISVQVPALGIHFSPVRYSRLMELLNILYGAMQNGTQPVGENFQAELAPWNPQDLAAEAQILVWKVRIKMITVATVGSYIVILLVFVTRAFLLMSFIYFVHRELAILLLHGSLVFSCCLDFTSM